MPLSFRRQARREAELALLRPSGVAVSSRRRPPADDEAPGLASGARSPARALLGRRCAVSSIRSCNYQLLVPLPDPFAMTPGSRNSLRWPDLQSEWIRRSAAWCGSRAFWWCSWIRRLLALGAGGGSTRSPARLAPRDHRANSTDATGPAHATQPNPNTTITTNGASPPTSRPRKPARRTISTRHTSNLRKAEVREVDPGVVEALGSELVCVLETLRKLHASAPLLDPLECLQMTSQGAEGTVRISV
jgi:hypothetical protein